MTYTAREKALLSNTDVLGYIRAENARIDAECRASGCTFWTLMSEDLAEEYANVYEMELMFAHATYADMHKGLWGCKSWLSDSLTLEDVESEISRIAESIRREAAAEAQREAEELAYAELCAAENAREEARAAEEARTAAANAKIDMLFSIQDALMGY